MNAFKLAAAKEEQLQRQFTDQTNQKIDDYRELALIFRAESPRSGSLVITALDVLKKHWGDADRLRNVAESGVYGAISLDADNRIRARVMVSAEEECFQAAVKHLIDFAVKNRLELPGSSITDLRTQLCSNWEALLAAEARSLSAEPDLNAGKPYTAGEWRLLGEQFKRLQSAMPSIPLVLVEWPRGLPPQFDASIHVGPQRGWFPSQCSVFPAGTWWNDDQRVLFEYWTAFPGGLALQVHDLHALFEEGAFGMLQGDAGQAWNIRHPRRRWLATLIERSEVDRVSLDANPVPHLTASNMIDRRTSIVGASKLDEVHLRFAIEWLGVVRSPQTPVAFLGVPWGQLSHPVSESKVVYRHHPNLLYLCVLTCERLAQRREKELAGASQPTMADSTEVILSERARSILEAMLDLNAIDSDHRFSLQTIVVKALGELADVNALKQLMSQLRKHALVMSKKGPKGGYWLTEVGKQRANRIKS